MGKPYLPMDFKSSSSGSTFCRCIGNSEWDFAGLLFHPVQAFSFLILVTVANSYVIVWLTKIHNNQTPMNSTMLYIYLSCFLYIYNIWYIYVSICVYIYVIKYNCTCTHLKNMIQVTYCVSIIFCSPLRVRAIPGVPNLGVCDMPSTSYMFLKIPKKDAFSSDSLLYFSTSHFAFRVAV